MTEQRADPVSVKFHTENLTGIRQMALSSLGGTEVYAEPGLSVVKFSNGGTIEIYGPGANIPGYLFRKNSIVVSYTVKDLDMARREAEYSGMKTIASGRHNGNCYEYFHLSDAEGNIIELLSKSDN